MTSKQFYRLIHSVGRLCAIERLPISRKFVVPLRTMISYHIEHARDSVYSLTHVAHILDGIARLGISRTSVLDVVGGWVFKAVKDSAHISFDDATLLSVMKYYGTILHSYQQLRCDHTKVMTKNEL